MRETRPVPLENRNLDVDLRFVGASGGVRVFVDQAAQDGFSEDPFAVEVGHGDAGSVEFVIGDALGDALVPVLLWGSGRRWRLNFRVSAAQRLIVRRYLLRQVWCKHVADVFISRFPGC
jgi:hypothetical protein